MDFDDPESRPGEGVAYGVAMLALRLVLVFAVIGVGYAVYEYFGSAWFYVFFFAFVALRLHFEIRWIEKNVPPGVHPEAGAERKENPFRKR